jgi:hypothetical protein
VFRILTAPTAGALVLLLGTVTPSAHGQAPKDKGALVVIVNAENGVREVPLPDLARIYLGKKTLWDSGTRLRIHPAMLDEEQAVVREFIEKDIQRSVDQYRAYWKHMLFSGGGTAPRTFRTAAQVVDFVAREPGAVGILAAPPTDDRVRVIEVKGGR